MTPIAPASSAKVRAPSTVDQVFIALLWFAFFAQWMAVVPIIVPQQVQTILGPQGALKEGLSGTILAAGAFVSMVVTPLAGALSDRRSAPKRRPYLVTGILGSSLCLALMIPFGASSSLVLYALV